MVILGHNDVFKVHKATLVADYDRETLTNLYQPLVGYGALALYFTLWSEGDMQRVNPVSAHEALLAKMKISVGEFIKARKALEGVGLLRTYLEDNAGAKIYTYELYAPKTPNEFFSDTLLYGLLINYIGEVDAKKLNNFYSSSYKIDGEDISSSFKEVFHPDFQNVAFIKALNNNPAQGRNRAKMSLEFTFEKFFDALKEVSQISERAFSKTELKEIMRLASLNGLNEVQAANIVANFYDPSQERGKRVDLSKVTKAFQEETNYSYLSSLGGKKASQSKPSFVSSSGALAQKINLMESVSPKDYLAILQNGTEPALPDLKLIDYLSKKFRLNNSVLNAVIDYTLEKNNNVLSKAYCEKICASIARSNIETTLDAMNYLKSIARGPKKEYVKEEKFEVTEVPTMVGKKNTKPATKEDEKEWESLMAELEEIGDDNDGKA